MTASRTPAAKLALLLLLAATGCDLIWSDPKPSEISLSIASLAFDAIGDTATITVTVYDEDGSEMRGQAVEWVSGDNAVARVAPSGLVTSTGRGRTAVTVTAGKVTETVAVVVTPEVAELVALSSRQQEGIAGEPASEPVRVEARDRLGNPLPGAALFAQVDAGGGSLDQSVFTADATGRATVNWTFGPVAGALQQMRIRTPTEPPVQIFFLALTGPGPVAEVLGLEGDGQVALPGATLPAPVRVQVTDRLGNPRAAEPVTVEVTAGGGSVDRSGGLTDEDGIFEVIWTTGPAAGPQGLRATAGDGVAADFSATTLDTPVALVMVQGGSATGVVATEATPGLVVRLEDTGGLGISAVPILFEVTGGDGTVASAPGGDRVASVLVETDAAGQATLGSWLFGETAGAQEVTALFPGLPPVVFTADVGPDVPATLIPDLGNFQTELITEPLPEAVGVRVEDRFGNAVPGVSVDFQLTGGGGSLSAPSAATDGSGEAVVQWTLGPFVGLQTVTASVTGAGDVQLHAAGILPSPGVFDVESIFITPRDPLVWAAFEVAANRWSRVVSQDVPDVLADVPPSDCDAGTPEVRGLVDDVRIFVAVRPIDGESGTIGSAGPCWLRGGSDLPFLGRMQLDVADIPRMIERGTLVDLVTHEIGHVLGIGTLWRRFGYLQDPSLEIPGADTHFNGPEAVAAFDASGGSSYTGRKVPVENTRGGPGTQDVHWRESVMREELMTGFIDPFTNPLSTVTAASLGDLGYVVDLAGSDSWGLAPPAAPGLRAGEEPVHLADDVWWIPLRRAWPIR